MELPASSSRRPCFIEEEDDGLASLAELEAGVSSNHHHNHNHPFFNRSSLCYNRSSSLRNLSLAGVSSPRSARFYESRFEDHHHQQQPHFLESCFLCKKPLADNRDIFMYRGDTPFCSEECRQEQMDIDEAKEKNWNMKALRIKDQKQSSSSPTKTPQDYSFRTGTLAAA